MVGARKGFDLSQCPPMAQSGHLSRARAMSAFGGKADTANRAFHP
jgi:hypothetical protein